MLPEKQAMVANYNLRPLWDAILDIYRAISDICERHDLRFYVAAGNCLGAVRHKGFIPWDDDMDVFMPWEDYDKFWQYAKEELPEYWKDVGWWNTPEFTGLFGKIQETRREVVEKIERETGLHLKDGVFVDVFPLVNRPFTIWEKFVWKITGMLYRLKANSLLSRRERITFRSKVAGMFSFLTKWMYPSIKDAQTAMLFQEKRARKYPRRTDGFCGWYQTGIQDVGLPIPTRFFNNVAYLPYDSIKVPVPEDYDGYLRYNFGDYMKLPAEEKRIPRHTGIDAVPWRFGPTGKDVRETTTVL